MHQMVCSSLGHAALKGIQIHGVEQDVFAWCRNIHHGFEHCEWSVDQMHQWSQVVGVESGDCGHVLGIQ